MSNFIEIPSCKKRRTKIYGFGVNDAPYNVVWRSWLDGKRVKCPFYIKWSNMLMKCYSKTYCEKHQHVDSSTVCEDWLSFMNFKNWLIDQPNWQSQFLRKDEVKYTNKVFSPEFCTFSKHSKSKYIGSNWDKNGMRIQKTNR